MDRPRRAALPLEYRRGHRRGRALLPRARPSSDYKLILPDATLAASRKDRHTRKTWELRDAAAHKHGKHRRGKGGEPIGRHQLEEIEKELDRPVMDVATARVELECASLRLRRANEAHRRNRTQTE